MSSGATELFWFPEAQFKRCGFVGVHTYTLVERWMSELHVGLKGLMTALLLKDLTGLRASDDKAATRALLSFSRPLRGGRACWARACFPTSPRDFSLLECGADEEPGSLCVNRAHYLRPCGSPSSWFSPTAKASPDLSPPIPPSLFDVNWVCPERRVPQCHQALGHNDDRRCACLVSLK